MGQDDRQYDILHQRVEYSTDEDEDIVQSCRVLRNLQCIDCKVAQIMHDGLWLWLAPFLHQEIIIKKRRKTEMENSNLVGRLPEKLVS